MIDTVEFYEGELELFTPETFKKYLYDLDAEIDICDVSEMLTYFENTEQYEKAKIVLDFKIHKGI